VVDGVGFAEWNGNFRDWWRTFLNDDGSALNTPQGVVDGGGVLTASAARYDDGRRPYHSLNFVTSHDGMTLFDLFAYSEKQNACGPLNPICCEDACSSWCDATSGESNNHSRTWPTEYEKRQMMRNAFAGLLLSHGTPMILGGDEWMRTQYGNNNAYSTWADNEWNWFRWGEWTSGNANNVFRHRMHDFVRGLVRFRLDHTAALSPARYGGGMPMSWKDPSGADAHDGTWAGRAIAQHYVDDGSFGEGSLFVAINGDSGPRSFTLPAGSWSLVIDTQAWYDLPGTAGEPTGWFDIAPEADPFASANLFLDAPLAVGGSSYELAPRSIAVFVP
jgi:glycogen operon protein